MSFFKTQRACHNHQCKIRELSYTLLVLVLRFLTYNVNLAVAQYTVLYVLGEISLELTVGPR